MQGLFAPLFEHLRSGPVDRGSRFRALQRRLVAALLPHPPLLLVVALLAQQGIATIVEHFEQRYPRLILPVLEFLP